MSPAFDPIGLLTALEEHAVRYVIIGGIAGVAHGSPLVTNDLDICPERSMENLERLARALRDLGARLRGVEEDVPFILEGRTLAAGDHFTFVTRAGNVDCLATPAGTTGYEELARASRELDLDGLRVKVCSLDDLIRMKLAAGRPQDRAAVEVLAALREELEGGERGQT